MAKIKSGKAKVFAVVLVLLAAVCLIASCSAKPKQVKVGILNGHDAFATVAEGFKAKLAELGYAEGDSVVYDLQTSGIQVDMELYKKLAQQLVDDKVDLILCYPTEATVIAKQAAAGKIPVVFVCAATEDTGIIDSIQSPGVNISGVRYPTPEIALRRFDSLMQVKPGVKRLLVPYLKGYPTVPSQLKALAPAAKDAGVEITELAVAAPPEIAAGLAGLKAPVDAMLFLSDPLSVTPPFAEPLFQFAGKKKIPIASLESSFGGVDAVVGVFLDTAEAGKQAALLADKIFKGAAAGGIPVVTSENQLTVNYKAAQQLGLTVPEGLLKQAVKVVR